MFIYYLNECCFSPELILLQFSQGEELKEQVADEFIPWVSQYLVMRRASIEPNFHTLYSCFVDVLKIHTLTQMVIKETYRNIKVFPLKALFILLTYATLPSTYLIASV